MKRLFVAAAGLLICAAGFAHEYQLGSLSIGHPYARPTAPAQPAGGGYMKLVNRGAEDRLVSVSVASTIAERVEMHAMSMDGDVMRMRQMAGIDIPAGQTVELRPGGLHLMFIGLKAPFTTGQRFPVKLMFRNAGEVSVEVQVEPPSPGDGSAHRH